MDNQLFVTYERALALKELGFDEDCFAFYNGKFLDSTDYNFDDGTSKDIGLCIKVPLKQQVFKFFREKYELGHTICPYYFNANITELQDVDDYPLQHEVYVSSPFTYEEAENACIDKLISICKHQDNGTSN
jgi:hypothetical protein